MPVEICANVAGLAQALALRVACGSPARLDWGAAHDAGVAGLQRGGMSVRCAKPTTTCSSALLVMRPWTMVSVMMR